MAKNMFIHPLYIFTKDPKGSPSKEKKQHQGIAIAAQTPLVVQSLVREAIHLHRASTMCQRCQDLAGPLDYIQFLVHKQFSTSTQPCDSLYCNHNLDERQLQPTKLLEA